MPKILKYGAYATFGVLIFIFFTYLNFPYGKLKDKIFDEVRSQTGLNLDASELKPTLFFEMNLLDVTLGLAHSEQVMMDIPQVSISPSFISLLTLNPKFKLNANLTSGNLYAAIVPKPQQMDLVLTLKDVDLKRNFKKQMPMGLGGIAQGEFHFFGNVQDQSSLHLKSDFEITKLELAEWMVFNMKIPALKFSKFKVNAILEKQKLAFQTCELGSSSDDLYAVVQGDALLNFSSIARSQLNLGLKLKLSEKLKEEFRMFLPFIQNALAPDGYYHLKITGPLTAPLALPQRS
ncbi:MAG: type II secretion system protein GspN [Deltaproteobacteria bacterium]|nr:type II secretion system protein GspN [Deltaproteobacteria bacterium]